MHKNEERVVQERLERDIYNTQHPSQVTQLDRVPAHLRNVHEDDRDDSWYNNPANR